MTTELGSTPAVGAADLHERCMVIDGMNNAALTSDYFDQILSGGINATMVPVSISDPFHGAIEKILTLRSLVESCADRVVIAESVADLHAAKRGGRLALILALEDTRALEKDVRKIGLFHDLGIRRMQLVYTTLNDVGCGAGDVVDAGLSSFGREVVRELQAKNMLIDLCHCGPSTHADAIALISRPCVWSHTNAKAVFDHPNNLTDEQLDAVARNGGVVGISAVPFYSGPSGAMLDAVIDHVDHVTRRIGVEHVAIGTAIFENHPPSFWDQFANLPADVYGTPPWRWPDGIETISLFGNITEALAERDYTEEQIELILGRNYLRVLEAAWGA